PHVPFSLAYLAEFPGFVHLMCVQSGWPSWAVVGVGIVGLLALQMLLALCLTHLARHTGSRARAGIAVMMFAAVAIAGGVAQGVAGLSAYIAEPFAPSLAVDVWQTVQRWQDPAPSDEPIHRAIDEGRERLAAAPHDLRGLGLADVHVIIVESYGRVALRNPDLAPAMASLWQELAQEAAGAGFSIVSSACEPAINGGASWLAHAELFCSLRVADRRTWELLLASDTLALPKLFRAAGYTTVEAMPAMDRHWPEGQAFYGFDQSITQLEFGYSGFRYGFGVVPDQFVLHHLLEHVIAPAQTPLFTTFLSASSHGPFKPLPPFVEDWNIGANTFETPPAEGQGASFFAMASDPDVVRAYRDAIAYSLRTAIGFTRRLQRPSVVVLLGDHQPPISRLVVPPDTTRDVPIHVLSNRPELLEPWLAEGFVRGAAVPGELLAFPLAQLAPRLLRVWAR
ncbi:MAG: sulfatase-like hydrolase/transferase, partial [Planctomycetota bacterium]